MNEDDKQDVLDTVESEGFDYAFQHYSHFEQVEDARFHELRLAYVKAAKELALYIGFEG